MPKINDRVFQKFMSFFTVGVDSYVSSSMNTIGWTDNTNGCFTHWIFERMAADMQSKRAQDNAISGLMLQHQKQEAEIESEKKEQ